LKASARLSKPLAALSLSAAFLIGTAMLGGCGSKEDPAAIQAKTAEYIERADSYRRQGQFRAAIIEARNALQQNPNDRGALLALASIFNELGQGKPAIKLLEPIAKNASRSEVIAIAEAYLQQHKYHSTLEFLAAHEQRLNLADDADINLIKARAELGRANPDAAEKLLAKLDKTNVQVGLVHAQLLQQRGEHEASNAEIARLLQQHPDNVDVLAEAALQAERDNKLDEAQDLLSKILMNLPQTDLLLPQKTQTLQRLVSVLTKLGRSNEALIYAKTLSEANPSGALLQDKFKQGLELFQAGKLDEAEPILSEVYGESKNEMVGMLLGMIRYAKKDLSGAAEFLGNNIDPEIAPEAALTTLAATQLQLAQPEKLLALFDAEDRKRIKSPELKMLVGIALVQTGARSEGSQLIDAAQSEQPANPAMAATLARYYLASQQPDKAIATLETALKARSDSNLSQLLIAAYAYSNQPDKALTTAQTLANSTPPAATNWWVLGRTALQLQKLDIAEPALRKALSQQPDLVQAQLDLGQLYLMRKQSKQAEDIYRAVLKQQADLVPALKGLVASLAQGGMQADAREPELLKTANNDNAKAVLAEYYLRQQKLVDAERQLAGVAQAEAVGYPAQLRLQLTLMRAAQALQAKDFDKARALVASGLELNPRSPELLVLLARLDLQAKNIDGAKKIAAQLAQLQSQSPSPQLLELNGDIAALEANADSATHYRNAWKKMANDSLAQKLYQSVAKDQKAADAFVDEWIKRLPNSANARFMQGVGKQQAGDYKGATAAYEAALERNPKDARALNNLAWLYFELGDKRALPTAEKAYALQPESAAVLDTYGWIQVKSGRKQDGLKLLQKAYELAPESTEIKQHLDAANQTN